jgi:F420-0:gamma-glutamyl ligase-like protein
MITLTPDEVTLIKSVLTALRGIKVRDIDRALLVLSKKDGSGGEGGDRPSGSAEN